MITIKGRLTFDKHVKLMYEEVTNALLGLRHSTEPNSAIIFTHTAMVGRKLGNMIYDAPDLWTGMCSTTALQIKLNDFTYTPCKEHHHSRQKGGDAIRGLVVDHFYDGTNPTFSEIETILEKYCQVHYTTPTENNALAKFQKHYDSEESYKRAGISLIYARDLFTKGGRHSLEWKAKMHAIYQPLIDQALNNALNQPHEERIV